MKKKQLYEVATLPRDPNIVFYVTSTACSRKEAVFLVESLVTTDQGEGVARDCDIVVTCNGKVLVDSRLVRRALGGPPLGRVPALRRALTEGGIGRVVSSCLRHPWAAAHEKPPKRHKP
jgi:hypothetical protein